MSNCQISQQHINKKLLDAFFRNNNKIMCTKIIFRTSSHVKDQLKYLGKING